VIDFDKLVIVMDLPTTNDQYAMKDYWDRRYMEEVAYDWFARYESFAHHIGRTINTSDRILQLGRATCPLHFSYRNTKSLQVTCSFGVSSVSAPHRITLILCLTLILTLTLTLCLVQG